MRRALVGDNPFTGVNHLSQERARERLRWLSVNDAGKVVLKALSSGADGFVFSLHPTNTSLLNLLRETEPDTSFGLYPIIPYAQKYVRLSNEKGVVGLIGEVMGGLNWDSKLKALVGGGVSAVTLDPFRMITTYLDAEIQGLLSAAPPKAKLEAVFLHDLFVDLAASLQLGEVLKSFISHVNKKYKVKAGLVTRNLAPLVGFLERSEISTEGVCFMTPFNKVGFQMNPSRTSSERVLDQKPGLDVIGMSILASGLLSLGEALEYIASIPNLRSVVVGVSSEAHAVSTFSALRSLR